MNKTLHKIKSRILRNIYEIPLLKYQNDMAYLKAIAKHIPNLPILSNTDIDIVKQLKSEGIAITSLEQLNIASHPQFFQAAKNLMPKIPPSITDDQNEFVVHANAQQMLEHPEIFLWGLEQRLLNIVENYLGLSVAYHGAYFRRDIANQLEQGSRLWHIDKEDCKVIKIIVYLNDVDEYTGPFQYIPNYLTSEVVKNLNYKSGYICDQRMQEIISPEKYQSCTGTTGTVIFAATGSIFHRGKPPIKSDRFAIFFDYTSRRRQQLFYTTSAITHEYLLKEFNHLSAQQQEYIFWQK
jgi:hypothetical protein